MEIKCNIKIMNKYVHFIENKFLNDFLAYHSKFLNEIFIVIIFL